MAVKKLGVIGQSYSTRTLTAAAQVCQNLYAEIIQDPNETQKNKAFFYGRPGYHSFINTGGSAIRGIYSGGGRLFIAWDTHLQEFNSSGSPIGTNYTISNGSAFGLANSPVQIFPNGNQLFVVASGIPYVINPPAGAVQVTTGNFAGFVTTVGTDVFWISGDHFPTDGSWSGAAITINGSGFTISVVLSDSELLLTASAGANTNVAYSKTGANLAAGTGAFLNDTFFAAVPFTRSVNFGSVSDSTGPLWNGLNFISKDSWPDAVRGILADASQLYLFGTESSEVWTGNSVIGNNPFVRIDGASFRVGMVSPWSCISIDGHVYFMGGNSQGEMSAYVLNGFTPVRISQHGQEQAWQAANLGINCISWSITFEGHSFWVIYFTTGTSAPQCWYFDITTGGWGQWVTGTSGAAFPFAYHSFIPEFGNGKHLIGGPASGVVYEMNPAFYDDNGADIWWRRALPHQYNSRMQMFDSRLEVEMETGTAPSGTPTITLDYSDDRGHTFGNSETQPIGTTAAYSVRVFWTALGSYFDRVYRITGQGQGRVALIDIELDQESGIV